MNECEMQIQLRQPPPTPLPSNSSSSLSLQSQTEQVVQQHRSRLETELNLQKQKQQRRREEKHKSLHNHVLDLKVSHSSAAAAATLYPAPTAATVQHLLDSFDSRSRTNTTKCVNMSSEQAPRIAGMPLASAHAQQPHLHHNGIDLSPRSQRTGTAAATVAGNHYPGHSSHPQQQLGAKMGEPKRVLSDQNSSSSSDSKLNRTSNSININNNNNSSSINHSSPSSASSGSSDCNSPPSNGNGNGRGGGGPLNGSAKSGNGGRLQFFKGEHASELLLNNSK